MFKKSNFKKFVSIIVTVIMLSASLPALADNASDSNQIYYTDFSDLKEEGFTGVTSATTNLSTGTGGFKTYVTNADVTSAEGSRAMAVLAEDSVYGSTLVLTKEGLSAKYLGFDVRVTPDSNKTIVIKTAVKRTTSQAESDAYISMGGNRFVRFAKNGVLYVNADESGTETQIPANTNVKTWELDTWYDITIKYSPSTQFSVVTIDGGAYENTAFYCDTMSSTAAGTLAFSFANHNTSTTNVNIADFHIAYVEIKEESPMSLDDLELESHITFNGIGIHDKISTSQYRSLGLTANSYSSAKMSLKNADADHGISTAIDLSTQTSNGSWSAQLEYKFNESQLAPFTRMYSKGALVMEYSVNMDQGMSTNLTSTFESKGNLNTASYGYNTPVKVGYNWQNLSIVSDKWYNIMRVANFDNGKVQTFVYDPANPSRYHVLAEGDLSESGAIQSLSFVVANDAETEGTACAYIDDISIYTTADLNYVASYPASDGAVTDLDAPIAFEYSAPLASAQVEVKHGNTVVDSSLYELSYVGKSVIVTPVTYFAPSSTYTVTVSNAKDVFGNTLAESQTLTYSTPAKSYNLDYEIYSATYNADTETYTYENITADEITDGMTIKIGATITGNTAFTPLYIYCVYDKSTNELLALNYFNKTEAVTEYTVSHDRGLPLECNEGTYVKVFAWDRNTNSPLVDSVRIDY